MPCMKCSNGKYKYGVNGSCVFNTLEACHAAAAAIHIQDEMVPRKDSSSEYLSMEDMYKMVNKDK